MSFLKEIPGRVFEQSKVSRIGRMWLNLLTELLEYEEITYNVTESFDDVFPVFFLELQSQDHEVVGNKYQQRWLNFSKGIHRQLSFAREVDSFPFLMLTWNHQFSSPVTMWDRNGRCCWPANKETQRLIFWFSFKMYHTHTPNFRTLPIIFKYIIFVFIFGETQQRIKIVDLKMKKIFWRVI